MFCCTHMHSGQNHNTEPKDLVGSIHATRWLNPTLHDIDMLRLFLLNVATDPSFLRAAGLLEAPAENSSLHGLGRRDFMWGLPLAFGRVCRPGVVARRIPWFQTGRPSRWQTQSRRLSAIRFCAKRLCMCRYPRMHHASTVP